VNRFLKYRKLYMPKTLPFEIPHERGFMIDTEFEFKIASLLAKNKVISTS
jgi:CMP-N-acetylneuraminic acid synthetase